MKFLASPTFISSLKKISQKKNFYRSIRVDLGTKLSSFNNSMEMLGASKSLTIQDATDANTVIKTRCNNSNAKVGTRGGYRIISLLSLKKDAALLMYVYPKTGPLGQNDIDDSDLDELIDMAFESQNVSMKLLPELIES